MKILKKNLLVDIPDTRITRLEIASPDIAKKARPGQFVVLMLSEEGERIPLTIVEADASRGTIDLIFQEVGATTRLAGRLNAGDSLYTIVGPLGTATEIKSYGRVILVGGGVGIAEIYPVAKALDEAENHITTILGARGKEFLILEKELRSVSDEFYVTTDDGSYGEKGVVTDVLKRLLEIKEERPKTDLIYAVGAIPMMRAAAEISKPFDVRTVVSLNALMVDATGMCGCCRVTVSGKTKFSCVDGPEFVAAEVDWDELEKRNRIYYDKEKRICKLTEQAR